MYWLRTVSGAPPHEMMQYDRDQNTQLAEDMGEVVVEVAMDQP